LGAVLVVLFVDLDNASVAQLVSESLYLALLDDVTDALEDLPHADMRYLRMIAGIAKHARHEYQRRSATRRAEVALQIKVDRAHCRWLRLSRQ
jgi:hypothetical protein